MKFPIVTGFIAGLMLLSLAAIRFTNNHFAIKDGTGYSKGISIENWFGISVMTWTGIYIAGFIILKAKKAKKT